jgi:SAM-dependent methyltransferase
MSTATPTDRLESLLDLDRVDAHRNGARGYLDLLGDAPPQPAGVAQSLMVTRALPAIYERWWRPLGSRMMVGLGSGMAEERLIADQLLALDPEDTVLDVACGPGNFTRRFAGTLGDRGLAVGFDASPTMLDRALRERGTGPLAYVRGDASALPFRDEAFDAVCCFAALYLFDDPFGAIDEMVRVLRPGGRIAVLTSCRRGPEPLALLAATAAGLSGVRVFGRDEITAAFRAHRLTDVRQRLRGVAQIVGARRQERPRDA